MGHSDDVTFTYLQLQLRDAVYSAMERRGLSQRDTAKLVGISEKHLSQMLNGRVEATLSTWQDIFNALGHRVQVRAIKKPKVTI